MSIFSEIVHSIYDIRGYAAFLKRRARRTFLYGLAVCLIYLLVTAALPLAVLLIPTGGVTGLARELIPDFTMEDGKLSVAESFQYSEYMQGLGLYIRVDTTQELVDQTSDVDLLAFDSAIVMDAEKLLVKKDGQVLRTSYTELGIGDLTKESLLTLLQTELRPYIGTIVCLGVLFLIGYTVCGYFLGAVWTAMVGSIYAGFMGKKMRFGAHYKLAVHARTMPTLLQAALSWIPVMIPYVDVLGFAISVFYMWRALKALDDGQETRQMPQWR